MAEPTFDKLIPDFLLDYPHAKGGGLDPMFPPLFGHVMEYVIMVDSDHAHDQKTHPHSLTDLIAFVGITPVIWLSKHHGAVISSTYATYFSAVYTVAEKAMILRYMFH